MPSRDIRLDKIKALSTILVVFVHAANLYGYANGSSFIAQYAYTFFGVFAALGVPLFYIVSGYLASSQYRDGKQWYCSNILKKTKTLFMPYLLWILLYWILEKIIIPKGQNISFTTIFLDIIGIPFCTAPVYAPLWFVRDLYLVTFFLPLIKRLTMHTTLSIASCALLWLTPLPNELQQVFTWYVFGVLLFNRKESFKSLYTVACEKIKNFNIILITIGIIGNVVISVYPIDLVMRILKAFWVLTVLSVFMRQPHTYQQCGKFENVGSRLFSHIFHASFSIYVLHGKILSVSQIVFAKFLGNSAIVLIWGYFALPIIIIIICLVLDSVLKKTPAYNLLTGSRK